MTYYELQCIMNSILHLLGKAITQMAKNINVTVWNEFRHEQKNEKVKAIYPEGMHKVISGFLSEDSVLKVRTATLDEPEHGLTDEVVNSTDVLVWWGHLAHKDVRDDIVEKICKRILGGMGFIALHSGHHSKIFRKLMGTSCDVKWRETGDMERYWVVEPGHPVVEGVGEYFELPHEEMYGERFDIPAPDQLILLSWFSSGEIFRSGCCFLRGAGKIFYFRPGHETYPSFYHPDVQKVIRNAVKWVAPVAGPMVTYGKFDRIV